MLSARSMVYLLGIVCCISACGPSNSDFTEFSTYKSPGGNHFVIVDSAHSKTAFGPETIRVYVVEKDSRARNHVVTTKIANDGGGISNENIKAEWINSDIIKFCLSGAEQEDSVLKINVRTFLHSEEGKQKCS